MKTSNLFLNRVVKLFLILILPVSNVSVKISAEEQLTNPPMTFLVVVDVSGSMTDRLPAPIQPVLSDSTKLMDVKRRLSLLAKHLPENTRVIVTQFDHEATQICDLTLTTEEDRDSLRSSFSEIQSRQGSTHLWRTADAQLGLAKQIAEQNPEGRVRVLLYTDGEDMEKAPGLDHNTIIAKYGQTLQSVVVLDWVTLGYDLRSDIKAALEKQGVNFTKALEPQDIVPLRAGFRLSRTTAVVGEEIGLLDDSIGVEITERTVDWGDRTPFENGTVLRHRYSQSGTYTVQYSVKTLNGKSSVAKGEIQITMPPAPVARIDATRNRVTVGETVVLTDKTEGLSKSRQWEYTGHRVSINPEVTLRLEDVGEQVVVLTVTDDYGQTSQASVTIQVDKPTPPVARMKLLKTCVVPGETLTAVDTTESQVAERDWNWGNDATAKEKEVTMTFEVPGEQSIVLKVTDAFEQSSEITQLVTVVKPTPPKAAFRFSKPTACLGDTVVLINESTDSAVRFQWTVGNDLKPTEQHATFMVEEFGDIEVKLVVWDCFDQSSEIIHALSVPLPEKPTVDFSVPESVQPGASVTLIDNSSGTITGDGQWLVNGELAGTGKTFEFRHELPGVYVVCREITGPGGLSKMIHEIMVLPFEPPKSGFTVGNEHPFVGDTIVITDVSIGPVSNVDFLINGLTFPLPAEEAANSPDKTKTQTRKRSIKFTCEKVGAMEIRQIVSGPGGTDEHEETVMVASRSVQPQAIIDFEHPSGRGPKTVRFENTSTGTILKSVFNPGDASPEQIADGAAGFSHTYEPGQWTPTIVVHGTEELLPSTWRGDEIVIAQPIPAWVWHLTWQAPVGLIACVGLGIVIRKRKARGILLQQSMLAGQLNVRNPAKSRLVRSFEFDGTSSEQTVDLDARTQIKVTSILDDDQVVRYRMALTHNGISDRTIDVDSDGEVLLGDYLVQYRA